MLTAFALGNSQTLVSGAQQPLRADGFAPNAEPPQRMNAADLADRRVRTPLGIDTPAMIAQKFEA
jgi:hypothetical protein